MQNIITDKMKLKAESFILEYRGKTAERSESQSFINDFFEIFGVKRSKVGVFEKPIKKKNEKGTGFADFFWRGKLIIESKSGHLDNPKHWEKTLGQAKEYIEDLPTDQKPQYILLLNFKRLQKHEVLNKNGVIKIVFLKEIPIENLVENLNEFIFILDFANRLESDEEKVNEIASNKMANLYDAIERKGYNSSDIAILLARILFCLFAEDTEIFKQKQFENFIKDNTDGKNLGSNLLELFDTLNTPVNKRKTKNKVINAFPYVNGDLFNITISKLPQTTNAMRDALLECCKYDWSIISPVIFGSLFQYILQDNERRESGSHYTSEKNILKVISPLFLDDLISEFEKVKNSKSALEKFRIKIASLIFLDPACGCGNFLVVTYRELRNLDIEIIKHQLILSKQYVTDASVLSIIPLRNFYGYEIDPTSAMIAEVAMWLTQHQMNMRLESIFDIAVPTIPLKEAACIFNVNALQNEWQTNEIFVKGKGHIIKPFNYIFGNPPFIGKQHQLIEQKNDLQKVLYGINGAGVLDFVTCWYIKSAQYLNNNKQTKVALVSTNSIAQGEQAGILWNELFNTYKLKIHFAHQTFKWHNEAKGIAAVHCVIIGFGRDNPKTKYLFEYEDIKGDSTVVIAKNINPYLVQGNDTVITKKRKPICDVPEISFGSMPNDGGNLLLTDEEKEEIINLSPNAKKWIRPLISAHEYLNGKNRWCLWLLGIEPKELKELNPIFKRVQAVKIHRESSNRGATNKLSATPHLFGEIRHPNSNYIFIPLTSSENRSYIPIDFIDKKSIANNSCGIVPNATIFDFGVLTSSMHMAWVKYVCGRLESRYRYSNEIVYNNYPFPKKVSKKSKDEVSKTAQKILDIRHKYILSGNSLADIYDSSTMPLDLQKAHQENNKAVDKCYNSKSFKNDIDRIEFLFELYEKYTTENDLVF